MFTTLTTVPDLLSDGVQFGMTDTQDTPFTHPTDESDWDSWLTTGELVGHKVVDETTGGDEGLTLAEMDALVARGMTSERLSYTGRTFHGSRFSSPWEIVAQHATHTDIRRVGAPVSHTAIDLEAAGEACERAAQNVASVRRCLSLALGNRDEVGNLPTAAPLSALTHVAAHLGFAARTDEPHPQVEWCGARAYLATLPAPNGAPLPTSAPADPCWRQVNHLAAQVGAGKGKGMVKRTSDYLRTKSAELRSFAARCAQQLQGEDKALTTYLTSDTDTPEEEYDTSLGCEYPSEEWGACRYEDEPVVKGRDSGLMYHLRHYSGIREGRCDGIAQWMRGNHKRARVLLTRTDSYNVGADGRKWAFTRLEEREWASRYIHLQAAWGRGMSPDYRESTALTIKQIVGLKRTANDIIRQGRKPRTLAELGVRVRKTATSTPKVVEPDTFDDLVFSGE